MTCHATLADSVHWHMAYYKWHPTPVPLAHTTPYCQMIIFTDICIVALTSISITDLATTQALVFITSGTVAFQYNVAVMAVVPYMPWKRGPVSVLE